MLHYGHSREHSPPTPRLSPGLRMAQRHKQTAHLPALAARPRALRAYRGHTTLHITPLRDTLPRTGTHSRSRLCCQNTTACLSSLGVHFFTAVYAALHAFSLACVRIWGLSFMPPSLTFALAPTPQRAPYTPAHIGFFVWVGQAGRPRSPPTTTHLSYLVWAERRRAGAWCAPTHAPVGPQRQCAWIAARTPSRWTFWFSGRRWR